MKEVKGILCALVTPLLPDESVDTEAVKRIVRHVDAGGTHGYLVLGSTGEQIALNREAKKAMVTTVKACIPEDKPLLVGCGATSTKLAIQNCLDAQQWGADAVIVTPPCFYPFNEDGLVKYFTEISEETEIPVYLYNISRFTKCKITANVVKRLLDNPKICGIKESDRDETLVQEILEVSHCRKDFVVIQGSDRIFLKSFRWGCQAGVTVVGNLVPNIAPAIYNAFKNGQQEVAEALQQKLLDWVGVVTALGKFPQELKTLMSWEGLCTAQMTSPYIPLTAEMEQNLKSKLDEFYTKYGKE